MTDENPASPNPYRSPDSREDAEPVSSNPSVYSEPWMQAGQKSFKTPDAADDVVGRIPADPENSVWDEPGLSRQLSGEQPQDAVTWIGWFQKQVAATTGATSWLVTLAVTAASGLWAIIAVFSLGSSQTMPIIMAVVGAPFTEEIMKIALTIYICEKRPWLYKSTTQIVICGFGAGLVFAVIENLLYLYVYIPNPTPGIILWRWTACVALHTGCSVLAAIGCVNIWSRFQAEIRMPRLVDGSRWIMAAIIVHGVYNFAATMLEVAWGS